MSPLVTMAKKAVRQIRDQMERPDQQWTPTLMYITNAKTFDVIGIVMDDMDEVAEMVTTTLRDRNAVEAVFVATVWMRKNPDPELIEGVMVAHVDKDTTEVQVARVKRTDSKPKLAEWQRVASDMQVPPMLIVDAMRAAI